MKLLTWMLCIMMTSCCLAANVWRSDPGSFWTGSDHETELTDPGKADFELILAGKMRNEQSNADGLDACQQVLQQFQSRAKNTTQLDTDNWMESSSDDVLCKAGLWCAQHWHTAQANVLKRVPAVLVHTMCRNCKRSTSHRIGCPGKGHDAGVVFIVFVSNNSSEGTTDFQLLVELLAALSDPAHFFLIHLDVGSSPDLKDSVIQIVKQLPQAALVQHPFACSEAGPSLTASELSALADVYYMYEQRCVDTVVLLSNSDTAVKSLEAIKGDLADHAQHNLLDYLSKNGADDPNAPVFDSQPRNYDHFYLSDCWLQPISVQSSDIHPRHNHTNRRHAALADWQIVSGSRYWVLSQAAVQYLVTDQRVLYLWHMLKHTPSSEDTFFHTALHNHPALSSTIQEGALRYIGSGQHAQMTDQDALLTCKYSFAQGFENSDVALKVAAASRATCR